MLTKDEIFNGFWVEKDNITNISGLDASKTSINNAFIQCDRAIMQFSPNEIIVPLDQSSQVTQLQEQLTSTNYCIDPKNSFIEFDLTPYLDYDADPKVLDEFAILNTNCQIIESIEIHSLGRQLAKYENYQYYGTMMNKLYGKSREDGSGQQPEWFTNILTYFVNTKQIQQFTIPQSFADQVADGFISFDYFTSTNNHFRFPLSQLPFFSNNLIPLFVFCALQIKIKFAQKNKCFISTDAFYNCTFIPNDDAIDQFVAKKDEDSPAILTVMEGTYVISNLQLNYERLFLYPEYQGYIFSKLNQYNFSWPIQNYCMSETSIALEDYSSFKFDLRFDQQLSRIKYIDLLFVKDSNTIQLFDDQTDLYKSVSFLDFLNVQDINIQIWSGSIKYNFTKQELFNLVRKRSNHIKYQFYDAKWIVPNVANDEFIPLSNSFIISIPIQEMSKKYSISIKGQPLFIKGTAIITKADVISSQNILDSMKMITIIEHMEFMVFDKAGYQII